jgi:Ca-activated chloride channel family protein
MSSLRTFCTSISLILLFYLPAIAGERERFLQAAQDSIPQDGQKTLSPYFFVLSDDPESDHLPLKSTRADVDIAGTIARVKVSQVYRNEGRSTLEALYIFPASTRAAVYAMKMTIGKRTIEARIKKRKEAREEYEKAKKEGKTASLLEQQRPNVFQMNVANILPNDEIKVELEYAELLVPRDGRYEFVYPTVVGPRYSNMKTDDVDDYDDDHDSWVESPYLHEGESPTYPFGLKATVRSGIPIAKIKSPTHDVDVEYESKQVASISLPEGGGGNRDFVLRYALSGDEIEHGLLLYEGEKENFFLMMMEPPERIEQKHVVPREYIFIMDVSGSMHGFPLKVSENLMADLLNDLGGDDYFNLLLFAGGNAVLSEKSLRATSQNIQKAQEVIDFQQGGGGTELLPALKRALNLPRTEGTSRIVVILTDGYVHVEKQAFELIRKSLGRANFFSFGIGSGVNRHLIEGMAKAGMGEPFVVMNESQAEKTAAKFRKYVSSPVMQGIQVEYNDFDAYDVEPVSVPDLFAERPVILFGKYRGKPEGSIIVRGHVPGGKLEGEIDLRNAVLSTDNSALGILWARHRIERLSEQRHEKAITKLGLKYSLLTEHTSFVAVDTVVRADGKKIVKVRQPLPLPQGVSDYAVGKGSGVLGCLGTRGRGGGRSVAHGRVMGSMSKSSIQSVIRKNVSKVNRVYERHLLKDPGLRGKIVVAFVVGPKGTVTSARITYSTIKSLEMQAEILEVIKSLKFSKPQGGGSIQVSYPFIFHSAG